jgi:uncharacterized protein (DUF1015 family)
MALIYPFRGYRYDKEVVGDLNLIVTQPYDKISPDLQKDYYGRSPHNVVRITKNAEKEASPHYPDAGASFRRWVDERILVQDASPSIYVYFEDYEIDGEKKTQRGFITLLDLRHSSGGAIPHERTLAEPKMDRLRLMRATECNEDMIYTLYTDERFVVNKILEDHSSSRAPEIEVIDDFGVRHRVWSLSEPKAVKKIQEAMVPEELFIADGHHRFETSMNFMKECEARGWKPCGTESFDKRLVACFNSADQGTTILPTHRLVRDLPGFSSRTFLEAASEFFDIAAASSAAELWGKLKDRNGDHLFGFYAGDAHTFSILKLKEEEWVDAPMLKHGEAYRHLDVSILHVLILDRLLGINESKLVSQSNVDYARDREACIQRVDEGRYQAVFFLNPTTVEQVQRVALLGERMPQKSTDFYPKLLTGLVFLKMNMMKPAGS